MGRWSHRQAVGTVHVHKQHSSRGYSLVQVGLLGLELQDLRSEINHIHTDIVRIGIRESCQSKPVYCS